MPAPCFRLEINLVKKRCHRTGDRKQQTELWFPAKNVGKQSTLSDWILSPLSNNSTILSEWLWTRLFSQVKEVNYVQAKRFYVDRVIGCDCYRRPAFGSPDALTPTGPTTGQSLGLSVQSASMEPDFLYVSQRLRGQVLQRVQQL